MQSINIDLAVFGAFIALFGLLSQLLSSAIRNAKEVGRMEAKIEYEFKMQSVERKYEDSMIKYRVTNIEKFLASNGYNPRDIPEVLP